jgi:hypothetical protein
MKRALLIALTAGLMIGCDDGDPTDDSDVGTEPPAPEISISGKSTNMLIGTAGTEGLCIDAVDPSAALEGGALNVLGSSTLDGSGNYTVDGVDVSKAPLAIFMVVHDCGAEGTVFPSATGIAAESYSTMSAGDSLTRDVLFVDTASAAGVNASLTGVGYAGSLAANGAIMGFVLDSDGSTRLGGATVACDGCDNVYYLDTNVAEGGFFASAAGINAATEPGVGVVVIPGGPVAGYQVSHPDKTFESGLFGSIPNLIAFTAWTAN